MLAGMMIFSAGHVVYGSSVDEEVAGIQAEKQAAQSNLAQTQSNIAELEGKKQELEAYLSQLDAQYQELTQTIEALSVEAGEKEDELKALKEELNKAKKAAEKQYQAMKIRIAYMYEKGGSTALELLLSSGSFADFLNRAENIMQISRYDRDMLQKYEDLQKQINDQETRMEAEVTSINNLMTERSAKQQEVQTLVSNTNANIASYVNQISASEEEAGMLWAQINRADGSISLLLQKAEEEAANESAGEVTENTDISGDTYQDDYGYDPDEDTTDSFSSSTSSDIIVEEEDDEEDDYMSSVGDSYEETCQEETGSSSDSGQGTYLGNFKLTAYCNCAQCCGTAGNLTASGTVPAAGRTVAMAGVPFGTQLLINGNIYTVEDLGTPYGHVDIYCSSHEEALSFGLQYADVYQVG